MKRTPTELRARRLAATELYRDRRKPVIKRGVITGRETEMKVWQLTTTALILSLSTTALADEQSADEARLDAGTVRIVAMQEKAQAVVRAGSIPVINDPNFVSGDYWFGLGEAEMGFGNLFFNLGQWDAAEDFFNDAAQSFVKAAGYYELAFPE